MLHYEAEHENPTKDQVWPPHDNCDAGRRHGIKSKMRLTGRLLLYVPKNCEREEINNGHLRHIHYICDSLPLNK